MMNHLNDTGIDQLIQRSYAALKSGDKEMARIFAQKAADLSPDSEQAWLILASISKSDQALYFLENALRSNPNSEAAKKGIRVIFEQMAAQGKDPEAAPGKKSEEFGEKEPPIKAGDTSPIPVEPEPVSAIERIQKKITEETPEETAQKEAADLAKDKVQATSVIPKSQLKKKLRKKKEPEPTPSPGLSAEEKKAHLRRKLSKPAAPADEPPTEEEPGRKIRFKKKPAKKIEETILPVEIPVVKREPEEDIPQPIPQKTRGKTSADSVDSPIPSEEIPAPTLADNLTRAFSKNEEGIDWPADRQPAYDIVIKEESEPQENAPVIEVIRETKTETKAAIELEKEPPPVATVKSRKETKRPKKEKKPKVKQPVKKKKVLTSGDVDIIEVILISLAAILLPVLAFLYFFLKN